MRILTNLFENNRVWADEIKRRDPNFFLKLSKQQSPGYLWIGCSDSRVPANQIVDLLPGELFVQRNVANIIAHSDMNCLSVIQYAVDVLKVKHIIVCGHYGCSGIKAAYNRERLGLIDNWLRYVQDIYEKHKTTLEALKDTNERYNRLCELNVIEQVVNVCQTTIVQDAWSRGQELAVHGWIYNVNDGLLRDLNICIIKPDELESIYREAISCAT